MIGDGTSHTAQKVALPRGAIQSVPVPRAAFLSPPCKGGDREGGPRVTNYRAIKQRSRRASNRIGRITSLLASALGTELTDRVARLRCSGRAFPPPLPPPSQGGEREALRGHSVAGWLSRAFIVCAMGGLTLLAGCGVTRKTTTPRPHRRETRSSATPRKGR